MADVLLTFNEDWADEFSPFGFSIMAQEEWDLKRNVLESLRDIELSWYFGTNEGYEEKGSFFLDSIKVKPISKEEVETLETLFGSNMYAYGLFPELEDIVEYLEEEDETKEVIRMWDYLDNKKNKK